MAACSALSDQVFLPRSHFVVEIVSPDDESWAKLDFCAAHDVDDLLIVDPQKREVHWLGLRSDRTL
jgi:Uma2 family endonuclease